MKRFTTTLNKWEKAIHYKKLYLTGSNKTEKSKIDKMDFGISTQLLLHNNQ